MGAVTEDMHMSSEQAAVLHVHTPSTCLACMYLSLLVMLRQTDQLGIW